MQYLNEILQKRDSVITYYPWSEQVLHDCVEDYLCGELPTIDLELTAKCSQCSCIYCDSRPRVGQSDPRELTLTETIKVLGVCPSNS